MNIRYNSIPKKIDYLIIGTTCLMIGGLLLLIVVHYFHVSMVFQYPEGDSINFSVALLMLGGIFTLLAGFGMAGILFLIVVHKKFLKKESATVNYSNAIQKVFLSVTLLMIIIGLIVLPLSCQYIENNVNDSYLKLITNEKPIETNNFQLTNNNTIKLVMGTFLLNTKYVLTFVSTSETLPVPFYMQISFLNETTNEVIRMESIYARDGNFITVKNGLTNEYHHIYIRQVDLPSELQTETYATTNMTGMITESDSVNTQTVAIHFIEDQEYIIQKGNVLTITTGYFRSYGMIITLSGCLLLVDLILLRTNKSDMR